jgi:hypothetical protein
VEWLAGVAEDEEMPADGLEMVLRLADEWVATDSDQLVLPIVVESKTTIEVEEEYRALLKQYGGEGLLNDMLMSDQDLEQGSRWVLMRTESLLTVEPLPTD